MAHDDQVHDVKAYPEREESWGETIAAAESRAVATSPEVMLAHIRALEHEWEVVCQHCGEPAHYSSSRVDDEASEAV